MCGIAGHFGAFPPDLLGRMQQRIAHRGPDGAGRILLKNGRVGLAHRRLAILDLSDAGLQPMWSADRAACVVFNGEIYNFRELRSELSADGLSFRTESDTEVLLAAYRRWGADMLGRLDGMFAFAIWDTSKGQGLIARDRYGVKPLYLGQTDGGVLFSSEIKALLECRALSRKLDGVAIRDYLSFMYCPGDATPFTAVRKVLPGEAALIDADGTFQRRWRFAEVPTSDPMEMSEAAHLERIDAAFGDAVRRQLVSDAPIGAFLSGGLDSSGIVSVAAREIGAEALPCFTIATDESSDRSEGRVSDLPYAREVARHLGVDLHEIPVTTSLMDDIQRMVYHLDEPFGDMASLNVFRIASHARELGVKVLLSGTGGDEVFAGYRRHTALMNERWWSWAPASVRRSVSSGASRLPTRFLSTRRVRKALMHAHLSPEDRLIRYARWLPGDLARAAIHPDLRAALDTDAIGSGLSQTLSRGKDGRTPLGQMLHLDTNHFLADFNHIYSDKMSMAAGIEVRVPFCDIELSRAAAALPDHMKVRGTVSKYALKALMERHLPRHVIHRPKTGFGVPMRSWVGSQLSKSIDTYLSPQRVAARGVYDPDVVQRMLSMNARGEADLAYPIFAMMVFEAWATRFVDDWEFLPEPADPTATL